MVVDYHALTTGQREAYIDALLDSHRIRIDATVRNRDEKPVGSLTTPIDFILSGAVDVDVAREASRQLELALLDPDDQLGFESNSPANGALYADRFISIGRQVWVDPLDVWVDTPVFWGPVTAYRREGAEVSVTGEGKEILMLAPYFAYHGYTIDRRTRKDDGIRKVAHKCGERRVSIPSMPHRLADDFVVSANDEPWKRLDGGTENRSGKKLPGLIDLGPGERRMVYDTRGYLTARRLGSRRAWTFRFGRDLATRPVINYEGLEPINTCEVKGAKDAFARVTLPPTNPLSPDARARNGVPLHAVLSIETDLATDKECAKRAAAELEEASTAGVDISFESLVIPHLLEHQKIGCRYGGWDLGFRFRKGTIPLVAELQSIGFLKDVSKMRRKAAYR